MVKKQQRDLMYYLKKISCSRLSVHETLLAPQFTQKITQVVRNQDSFTLNFDSINQTLLYILSKRGIQMTRVIWDIAIHCRYVDERERDIFEV